MELKWLSEKSFTYIVRINGTVNRQKDFVSHEGKALQFEKVVTPLPLVAILRYLNVILQGNS